MAGIKVEDAAFLAGLSSALKELGSEGESQLFATGDAIVGVAKSKAPRLKQPDPRYRPGELADSIEAVHGRNAKGAYVDVGTSNPIAIFVEYGTIYMAAQPFMRPALSMAARLTGGGRGRSARSAALTRRATKRGIIRTALKRGQISSSQARSLSSQVSSQFRVRAPRRKR